MKNKDFNAWLSTFRDTIANYTYYVDFDAVYRNLDRVKVELNIMNSLVGKKNIEEDFVKLLKRYPEILKVIPILIAKREKEIFCQDSNGGITYDFNVKYFEDVCVQPNSHKFYNEICYFMRETGLFELISNRVINNLVDYVLGVEAGLSSNGRKNRGGHLMEDLVESFIQKAGFIKDVSYYKEMRLSDLEKITGLNLSSLSNDGKTVKRFDYVIISDKCVYACECNFYASSGSKLNETARSYKTLALESKEIKGFKFVWFTDGIGWMSAKNNLRETCDVLDTIYNIKELEEGVLEEF